MKMANIKSHTILSGHSKPIRSLIFARMEITRVVSSSGMDMEVKTNPSHLSKVDPMFTSNANMIKDI